MDDRGEVLYDVSGSTARIVINRPERRNALNVEVMQLLRSAFARARGDAEVRVVVLTGAGEKAFSAGGDLGGFTDEQSKVEQHLLRGTLCDLLEDMTRLGKPIVARVNGHALAGGFGLLCACDLAVAAEHAEFGMPEIDIGLWPFIITPVVRRVLPQRVALELMMTGRRLPAGDALRLGLVSDVVAREELDARVAGLCDTLASKSPLVLALGRDSFYASRDMRFREALDYMHGQLTVCLQSEDVIEGVTAFLQKRAPQWKGR